MPPEKSKPFKQGLNSQHGTVVGERVEGVDDKACGQQVALEQTQAVRTADAGTGQGDSECGCAGVGFQFAVQGEVDIGRRGFQLITAVIPHAFAFDGMRAVADQSPVNHAQLRGQGRELRRRNFGECVVFCAIFQQMPVPPKSQRRHIISNIDLGFTNRGEKFRMHRAFKDAKYHIGHIRASVSNGHDN